MHSKNNRRSKLALGALNLLVILSLLIPAVPVQA